MVECSFMNQVVVGSSPIANYTVFFSYILKSEFKKKAKNQK